MILSEDKIRKEVVRMASLGCTLQEIGQRVGLGYRTIQEKYIYEFECGLVLLKEELREAQKLCAKQNVGNATMLIWLGKIYLNQRESSVDEKVSEIDAILKYIDDKAACSNSQKSNSEAIAKQQLVSMYGSDQ